MSMPFDSTAKRYFGAVLRTILTSCSILTVVGQTTINQGQYVVVDQGPHHKVWQRITWSTNAADGTARAITNSYTELRTGMSRLAGNQWVDSSPKIEITPTGAQGTNMQHSVTFLGDINSSGAVDVTTPDGYHLKSSVLGLSYLDTSTGNAIFFADLQSSHGLLLSSGNEVVYPDAFSGCTADVFYENSIGGFEQLIVLRSQLPSPTNWGLNPDATMLQVITEFIEPPAPEISVSIDGTSDQNISFGIMQMGKGSAFALGAETNRIPVIKQWLLLSGRTCLVEEVPFESVTPLLDGLPAPPPGSAGLSTPQKAVKLASLALPTKKASGGKASPLKLAKSSFAKRGFAMDYNILTSQTNFTFQGDTTYYVSGTVSLSGTNNVVEGLTVIKFANSPSATISAGNIIWKTGAYTPAIFTAEDDTAIGDVVGQGDPTTNFYAGTALDLSTATTNQTIANVRFIYLSNALAGASITLQDSQVINCKTLFSSTSSQPTLLNVLIYAVNQVIANSAAALLTAENVTCHLCTNFFGNTGGTVNLTNCLFSCVTNWQCATSNTNSDVFLTSDVGVFQTVGGGDHYLVSDSAYRNAGTTNISPLLASSLAQRTTYPPLVYSNSIISVDTVFNPIVQRDVGILDLGYHYPPLDYAFGFVQTTNSAAICISNGAAIGVFYTGTNYFGDRPGISLSGGIPRLFSQGSCKVKNWIGSYNTVQEHLASGWNLPGAEGIVTDVFSSSSNGVVALNFTEMSAIIGQALPPYYSPIYPYLMRMDHATTIVQNCEFQGTDMPYNSDLYMTNCLVQRVQFEWDSSSDGNGPALVNNLFYGGTFDVSCSVNTNIVIQNNLFEFESYVAADLTSCGYGGCNAYWTNASASQWRVVLPTYSSDLILSQPLAFQPGPLGFYYQPTNSSLFNAGSTNAGAVGLYHFTVFTNQIKETNSIVDIGYHYVALDANGNPVDTNGDGIPDYFSDANGNGKVDSGEIGWNITGDLGLRVLITKPPNNSIVP